MTGGEGFKLHPGAAQDITDIWEYIADENPVAALRVCTDILDAIEKLVPFPHQGYKRPDLTSRSLRFKTLGNFIITYAPDEKPLLVIAVVHSRRSPRVIAAILRGRE